MTASHEEWDGRDGGMRLGLPRGAGAGRRHLLDVCRVAAVLLDTDQRVVSFTPGTVDVLEIDDRDIGHPFDPILDRSLCEDAAALLRRAVERGTTVEREVRRVCGTWYLMRAWPVPDTAADEGFSVTFYDVDQWHHWKSLHLGHARVLEMLATGRTLSDVLKALALTIEDQIEGILASVLLLDRRGTHLIHGAGPNLPSEYNRAINGVAIGPEVGACGTAAFRDERVIIERLAEDPRCVAFRTLLQRFRLCSCWSEPIRSSAGRVLGTFAMYSRTPRVPEPPHLRLMEWAAHVASIAIERTQDMSDLRRTRDHLAHLVEVRDRELAAARAEARRQQAELSHMSRLSTLGEMSAVLVHELAQPLSAVTTLAEASRRAASGATSLAAGLDGIIEQTRRASTIVQRLRSFVRKTPVSRERVDLNAVLLEIVPLMEIEAEGISATISIDTAAEPQPVRVDPLAIQQVVMNLARNGLDAMARGPADERLLRLRVARASDDAVQLSVADAGEGIDAGALDRIFEPFHTSKPDGLGLGLSIARRIIDAHGGRLWVVPNRERGMTFRLALPLDRDELGEEESTHEHHREQERSRDDRTDGLRGRR